MVMELRAPFPWMGGKRKEAPTVWRAFGADVNNYIEPFFGSGAVLLGRPGGAGKIETVNDIDGAVVNFWRALAADPGAVAEWCNWPVSELDMHARHAWLLDRLDTLKEELRADPHFHDPKFAGWWVWGICQWIGTGWCGGIKRGRPRPNLNSGQGVHASLGWQARPFINGNYAGMGVHSNLPSIGNDRGINGVAASPAGEWFRALHERLRRVRIVCGDWRRVLGPSVLGKGKNVGGRSPCAVFLDPPYSHEFRKAHIYAEDDADISRLVRDWALENGDDPDLRIALCGYSGEHEMPSTWKEHAWKAARGYAAEDNDNRERERIWFSPHCLRIDSQQSLFSPAGAR